MKRLQQRWQDVRYSLWFIPALIVGLSILLAALGIAVDAWIESAELPDWSRLFAGSADGARGTLEVIAGAMITIAALTFSITILVLSSVASQYTPRVIRTFMSSTMTKVVLGVFVGIHVYCLIVLRTVHGGPPAFVPTISVTFALLLAVVGVGFLIAFIHHIATSIQLSTIVASLAGDTMEAIDRLFPNSVDSAGVESGPDEASTDTHDWHPIPSNAIGYLQSVDISALARHAAERSSIFKMEKRVGEFVMVGEPLVTASVEPDKAQIEKINGMFAIGAHRTVEQDAGVGIRQLADIALRAISPASNDTTTAAICLDYLSVIMIKLAGRRLDAETDCQDGRRSLLVRCTDFETFLRHAFEQIRQHANDNLTIYLRLLKSLEAIARASRHPQRRAAIEREGNLVVAYARKNLHHADQQAQVEQIRQRLVRVLRD